MANIQQAAKWMERGMRVRRPYFAQRAWLMNDLGMVFYHSCLGEPDDWAQLGVDDLAADDWEIANPAEIGKVLEKCSQPTSCQEAK